MEYYIRILILLIIQNRITMSSIDRNFQFLYKCKTYQLENRLHQLVIPDKQISYTSLLSLEQILVSQYVRALSDQLTCTNNFNHSSHYSLPIFFAFFTKALNERNFEVADRIITSAIKEQPGSNQNRNILAFNKVKVLTMQGQIKKAIFHCENLLKSGDGSDYYTYQFLMLLLAKGRVEEAFKICQRHIENSNSNQKHKIQSIYIYLLSKIYEKDEATLYKKLERFFNNRTICIKNIYNIAFLLKSRYPEKALQLFKKIVSLNTKGSNKIIVLSKINIITINEKYYIQKSDELCKKRKKEILQECQQIINQLSPLIEESQQFEQKKQFVSQNLKIINQGLKSQNNKSFIQAIQQRNKVVKINQKNTQYDDVMSEACFLHERDKNNQNIINEKYFHDKRAENQRRLKFLLKKQRQLKKFFQSLQISKVGQRVNLKVIEKYPNSKPIKSIQNITDQQFKLEEVKYEQKKKNYQFLYQEGQINQIMNNFIDQWVIPYQKSKVKLKNIEKIKKFIVNLEHQPEQHEIGPSSSHISIKGDQRINKGSSKTFRVMKTNTSRRNSKMIEGLRNNDHISCQILSNLKINIAEKKKQQKTENFTEKKNFKQFLNDAQALIQQNKLEQAHELYVKVYKKFKEERQKQIILLKIAENFERLSFLQEAQKTYIKCTKFNNTEAFFRLGSLQIRNGNIQMGIQNLEKANCIDRHNSKIQIQLIYAYSLLEETTERALALASSLLKRNPQCIEALVMSSKILQKKGKLKQALDIALAIGNSFPSASIYHYIGLLYLNDSNVSEAFKFFHKAVQCDSAHYPSLIEIATIISEAKPQEAIQILKNVLSMDPQNQLAFARLGKIYETFENDYENALLIYQKSLQYSRSYENYVKIGDCQLKFGLTVDAYLSYKEALSLKKTSEVLEKIGEVHQIQHQEKKAMQAYSAALAELPKDNYCFAKKKKYLFKLGQLSLINQQFEAAYTYLQQAADMEESFQVLKLLGQACFGKGDYKQALQYYERAAAFEGEDNLELLESIAICFDKQEEYLASKEIYEKILAIDPKNIKCLNNLANILLILGKTNEAFYWFEFMLQQAPTSIEKRLRVADIYSTIGDWSKVQQHLMICYKQKENDIRVLERLVNLYKEKRDTKQINKFQKRLALIKNNSKNI